MKKRALISIYYKEGVLEFAKALTGLGWEILSTGGTSRYLQENCIPVIDISTVTKFPECLDGRVKTLHPAVHAGILARRDNPSHMDTLKNLGIETIGLICVNLYPFFEKVQSGLTIEETVEFIDIGGPTMLRSAAKNYRDVIVLSDPGDYEKVTMCLKSEDVPLELKKYLAGKVFNLCSAYDAAVARYLLNVDTRISGGAADDGIGAEGFPAFWPASFRKAQELRYGENEHQSAALYLAADRLGALGEMEQLNGKELGYNNIRDMDLAWKAACAFGFPLEHKAPLGEETLRLLNVLSGPAGDFPPACVAVKHNTPCGAAIGSTLCEAYEKTYACDPVSIYGGIVACNVTVDAATAAKLAELFLEIVLAPDFEDEALEMLKKKKNLRVMRIRRAPQDKTEYASVDGGLLVQTADRLLLEKWEVVTREKPESADIPDLVFGMRAVSHVKSNAIAVIKDSAAAGIGGGQTNRIWAAEQAIARCAAHIRAATENPALAGKAIANGKPARVLASDAFFPFADTVEAAAAAGIRAIIQPGGSIRDKESIEACDKHGIAMVFTGTRHFKH
jgi:phosphoribosylaminoimidazolecarboxamide formyltransferase/IMP cyclohydrolase